MPEDALYRAAIALRKRDNKIAQQELLNILLREDLDVFGKDAVGWAWRRCSELFLDQTELKKVIMNKFLSKEIREGAQELLSEIKKG